MRDRRSVRTIREELLANIKKWNQQERFRDQLSILHANQGLWFVYYDQWGNMSYQEYDKLGAQLHDSSRTRVIATFQGRRYISGIDGLLLDSYYIKKDLNVDNAIDLLTALRKTIKLYKQIESNFTNRKPILFAGNVLWWYNTKTSEIVPVKVNVPGTFPEPDRFLDNGDWLLLAKMHDGKLMVDENFL